MKSILLHIGKKNLLQDVLAEINILYCALITLTRYVLRQGNLLASCTDSFTAGLTAVYSPPYLHALHADAI